MVKLVNLLALVENHIWFLFIVNWFRKEWRHYPKAISYNFMLLSVKMWLTNMLLLFICCRMFCSNQYAKANSIFSNADLFVQLPCVRTFSLNFARHLH